MNTLGRLIIVSFACILFSCEQSSIENIDVNSWDSVTISKIHEVFSIDTSKYNCDDYPELVINKKVIKSLDSHIRQFIKNRKYLITALQNDDEFSRIKEVFIVEFYGNTYFAPNTNTYFIQSRKFNKKFESLSGDSTFTVSTLSEKADNSTYAFYDNSISDNIALNLTGMRTLTRIFVKNGSTRYEILGIQLW